MADRLDPETLEAVSSETRMQILDLLKKGKKNPSYIASEVGKHRSTVSEHLDKLVDAELVERHENPGKRRVSYSLTRKGRKTISSSNLVLALSSVLALVSGGILSVAGTAGKLSSFSASQSAKEGIVNNATNGTVQPPTGTPPGNDPLTALGILLLLAGILGLAYWLEKRTEMIQKLREKKS